MRTSELIQRIKVSYNFIRYGKGNVRLMTCGKCGGVFIHPISESPQEGEIITDIVNIGLHFFLKNVRPYAASCSEA